MESVQTVWLKWQKLLTSSLLILWLPLHNVFHPSAEMSVQLIQLSQLSEQGMSLNQRLWQRSDLWSHPRQRMYLAIVNTFMLTYPYLWKLWLKEILLHWSYVAHLIWSLMWNYFTSIFQQNIIPALSIAFMSRDRVTLNRYQTVSQRCTTSTHLSIGF